MLVQSVLIIQDSQEISSNAELSCISFDISNTKKIIPTSELQNKDVLHTKVFFQIRSAFIKYYL